MSVEAVDAGVRGRPSPSRGELSDLIRSFRELSVLVVGEAILDGYLHGSVERLCREAPVPIIDVHERVGVPGGAANTATNASSLGGRVRFLSVIGADDEGALLREVMQARGVPVDGMIAVRGRRTLSKHRLVADGQTLVRFDQGTTAPLDPRTEAGVLERLEAEFASADAIICSDYGYGVLTDRVLEALAGLNRRDPHLIVVDAKDLTRYAAVGPSAAKPNFHEAARLVGEEPGPATADRVQRAGGWGDRLLEATGAHIVAVTLDRDGAIVFERGAPPHRTYARPTANSKAAGAGDTFLAALTLALAAGASSPSAAEVASAASEVVVAKDGTSACSSSELQGWFWVGEKLLTDSAVLRETAEFLRRQGRRIVFTNGCFDILHRGHIGYLNQAKALGDVLVVGLNSDDSVRKLKGPERPINSVEDRAQVLSALSCVDYIIPFDEESPTGIIRTLRPHLYVKGGDYDLEMLPEAPVVHELGGEVRILPFIENRSTTGIIERIREGSP